MPKKTKKKRQSPYAKPVTQSDTKPATQPEGKVDRSECDTEKKEVKENS